VLWGVYGAETDFGRNLSTSSAGAQGPFQFMPSTAAGMGVNPHNFGSAAKGAARYLAQYKSRGKAGMLGAYNAGPAGNINNPETRAYIPKVLGYAKNAPYPVGASSGGSVGHKSKKDPVSLRAARIANAPTSSTHTDYTPSRTNVDRRAAIVDALLATNPAAAASGRLPASGGLLADVRQRIASGAYTTVTPESTRVTTIKERAAVRAAELDGARPAAGNPGTQRMDAGPASALRFASGRLGISERGTNTGDKIDQWQRSFGMHAQPWCGIFVGKALQRAGVAGVDARIASTAAIYQMARDRTGPFEGLVSASSARPGDVVVWNPGPNGHTGIVESVKNGKITTIEGNASDGVRRRVHPPSGAYYARPRYRG